MFRKKCIFCPTQLEEDPSDEHVIAENIGGKLHSRNLICKNCNSLFGAKLDENLRKKFEVISFWINFRKDTKRSKNLELKLDNKDYILSKNGRPKLKHPIIKEINGKNEPTAFSTMEDVKKYYQNQRNVEYDIQEIIKSYRPSIKDGITIFKKKIKKEDNFTWRACGKIIYEFLCLIKKDYQPSSNKFIDFVMGRLAPEEFPISIALFEYNQIEKNRDRIYHTIIIEGRKVENIVIGYLELFDSLKVLMLIDEDYKGDSFLIGHYHDLIKNNKRGVFKPSSPIPLDEKAVKEMVKYYPKDSDLVRCNQKASDVANKARLHPFKIIAKEIRNLIDNNDDLNIVQIEQLEQELESDLELWGLKLYFPEVVNQLKFEMMVIQKLIFMLDFLRKSFFVHDMNTTIFKRLISLLFYKGDKFRF